MSSALLVSEMGNVELLKTHPACYRCTVDLDASAVGWVASLWKSKKGRKHDELQGILRRGDEVLDTLHGRCACTHFCKQLALPCGGSFYFKKGHLDSILQGTSQLSWQVGWHAFSVAALSVCAPAACAAGGTASTDDKHPDCAGVHILCQSRMQLQQLGLALLKSHNVGVSNAQSAAVQSAERHRHRGQASQA